MATLTRAQAVAFRRAFADESLQTLEGLYQRAAAEALDILTRAGATLAQRGRARVLLVQYHELLAELDAEAAAWIETNLPRSYQAGITYADREMTALRRVGLNFTSTPRATFALVNREAVAALVAQMQGTVAAAHAQIGRRVADLFRQVAIESTTQGVAGGWTRLQTSKEMQRRLVEEGKLTFRDKLGREWPLERYTEMVARTTMREANVQGTIDRLVDQGIALVQVTTHHAADFCRYYEGKVFSIGETQHPDYPPLSSIGGGPPFHHNCRHALKPFVLRFRSPQQLKAGIPDPSILNQSPADLQRRFRVEYPEVAKAERLRLQEQAAEYRRKAEKRAARKAAA